MFAELFGCATAGKTLLFLARHGEGYTRKIASRFGISPQMVHEQLLRFERAGLMKSRRIGNVRLFEMNEKHPLHRELQVLLEAAYDMLGEEDRALIEGLTTTQPKEAAGTDFEQKAEAEDESDDDFVRLL